MQHYFLLLLLIVGALATGILLITFRRRFIVLRDLAIHKSRPEGSKLIVHIVSETAWITQGQGVHTAYVEMIQLLSEDPHVKIVLNNDGFGDVFHSHTYGPYYFYKGWRYKGRRILTAHVIPDSSKGTIPFWRLLLPLTTGYLKLAYQFADVIIAISPTVEQKIRELGVNRKIVRIYNPVLVKKWQLIPQQREQGRERLGVAPGQKVVLGVGQLQERKGVEDFMDMAELMPQARFIWVGGRPWGIFTEGVQRINERIAAAPPNLHFTGLLELEQMPEMYAAADIFLFPSYQENCPLAPLEAAASGLPVIFRNIPEYETLFTKEYLNVNTTEEFVALAGQLLNEPEFYDKAVKISAELIRDFDKDMVRQRVVQLYQDVFASFRMTNC